MSLISEGREKEIKPKTWQPGSGLPRPSPKVPAVETTAAVKAAGGVAGVWEEVILGEKVYAFRVVENVLVFID